MREDISVDDVKDLSVLTEEDAFQFLESGVPIILRLTSRNFYEVSNVEELKLKIKEHHRGAHEYFSIYME